MRSISLGRPVRIANAALLPLLFFASPGWAEDWRTFTSDRGFSIQYPGDWILDKQSSSSELAIKSEPGGQNGAIIKGDQAIIYALREKDIRTLPDARSKWKQKDDPVISQRPITKGKGDCGRAEEIVSSFDFGAPKGAIPQYQHTFLCETKGSVIVVELNHWADDKNQKNWQQIADRMLASLRVQN